MASLKVHQLKTQIPFAECGASAMQGESAQVKSPRWSATTRQLALFAVNFFRHPMQLGSLVPSSRFLVNTLLSRVEWERARVVVEYGPGIGNMTQEILKRMRSDATLVAIEMNPEFVRFIQREIADPRLRIICGSASEVRKILTKLKLDCADYVISGIPYTTIPANVRRQILTDTHKLLHPEGGFLVYQFTRTVLPYLEPVFGNVQQGFEPRNILPARLFFCTP
jgi:phospholipid N-methyltransferase